jgi:hypothetical protein
MSTVATRTTLITFTGDVVGTEPIAAASNAASPAQIQLLTTASGANTLTAPTGGSTPTALTIIPPAGNVTTLTLKGVTGDTGIALHPTDPTTVALASGFTTCCLTTGGIITGVRLIWN